MAAARSRMLVPATPALRHEREGGVQDVLALAPRQPPVHRPVTIPPLSGLRAAPSNPIAERRDNHSGTWGVCDGVASATLALLGRV